MSLRRRPADSAYGGSGSSGGEKDKSEGGLLRSALNSVDLYSRVDDEFLVKTSGGGRAFLIGVVLVLILSVREVSLYLFPGTHEHVVVDTRLGGRLQINMNLTFHALGCDEVHLDAMDVAGDNQIDVEHDMWKQRLSSMGQLIGEAFTAEPATSKPKEVLPEDYCGSCYGAQGPPAAKSGPTAGKSCCNTCADVVAAYRKKAWNVRDIKKNAEQCTREISGPLSEVKEGEGCNIAGSMLVNQVAGNFHFAIGDSVVRDGRHIHQFSPEEAPDWNSSHTIYELSFGDYYPGMINPLDNTDAIASEEDGTGLFQYFIKVVPTLYRAKTPKPGEDSLQLLERLADEAEAQAERKLSILNRAFAGKRKKSKKRRWRKDVKTNVYTYSAQFTPFDPKHAENWRKTHRAQDPTHKHFGPHKNPSVMKKQSKAAGLVLPGVFFVYDISPFMIQVSRDVIPFSHLITNLLAITGGVFSLANLLDSAAYYIGKRVEGVFLG